MKVYLVRHGQDDDSVRGGWSDCPLTELGIQQSTELADNLSNNFEHYNISKIYSSDIARAKQTATIIAEKLNLSVELMPEFREVNNGVLAGMDNYIAEKNYPNMYWRNLKWDEHYPNGESPKEFYERVSKAWEKFTKEFVDYDKNVLLVTHGGVINIIKCIANKTKYSNKDKYPSIPSAEIALEIEV